MQVFPVRPEFQLCFFCCSHVAASRGYLHCVKFLLRQPGVDIHARDRWSATPLSGKSVLCKMPVYKDSKAAYGNHHLNCLETVVITRRKRLSKSCFWLYLDRHRSRIWKTARQRSHAREPLKTGAPVRSRTLAPSIRLAWKAELLIKVVYCRSCTAQTWSGGSVPVTSRGQLVWRWSGRLAVQSCRFVFKSFPN